MRRFFRSADLAALLAAALIVAPLGRAAAQALQATNTDSMVVAHDSVVAPVDLRAVQAPLAGPVATAAVPQATGSSLGASMTGLRSAVHSRDTAAPLAANTIAQQRANLGQAQALMIVGGAALIVGAIIGDDPGTVIMVGGAVIGLYGLYQYLQ
jgi:hypothetical protein